MCAVALADAARRVGLAAVELECVDLGVGNEVAVRLHVDGRRPLVHRQQLVDVPVAGADRVAQRAVEPVQVQMLVTAALAGPEQALAVGEEAQVIVEVEPGRAAFGQHGALFEALGLDDAQLEALLVACFDLKREAPGIGQPIDAREVDVGVDAEVDPACLAAGRGDQAELDRDIGLAGGRVALLDDFGALGIDLAALDDVDRRFIVAFEGDRRIVGRPPVTSVACHLLLGDELGLAVVDGSAAIAGQRAGLVAGQVDDPEILPANE